MKLTQAQIKTAFNAYSFLGEIKLPCCVEVAMNIVELTPHAMKVDQLMSKVAEKNGWLNEAKTHLNIPADKMDEWNKLTEKFMEKEVEISLEVIKKAELIGANIPGSLLTELVKLKLIVKQ